MDALWKLVWALPLVLLAGASIALVLRKLLAPGRRVSEGRPRLSALESLSLSAETRVHLVECDGRACLIVESSQQVEVHALASQPNETTRSLWGFGPRWARPGYGIGRR